MQSDGRVRVLVYAPDPHCVNWIEQELVQQPVSVLTARTVAEVVRTLVEDPPPRPQILVADLDAMTAGELLHLHSVRDEGWFGSVVALGDVPITLRLSLRIETVIIRPYPRGALRRHVLQATQHDANTIRMPRING